MTQNFYRTRYTPLLTSLLGCALLAGCYHGPRDEESTTTVVVHRPPSVYVAPPRDDAEAIQRLATEIQVARDAGVEADALQRLHKYETDHNLTYQVQTTRIDTNTIVRSGSVQPYPIRVDVTVFKAQLPLYTFSFVPRDNRNLAILGE